MGCGCECGWGVGGVWGCEGVGVVGGRGGGGLNGGNCHWLHSSRHVTCELHHRWHGLFNTFSSYHQRKHVKIVLRHFVRANHRWPLYFPHKWPVMRRDNWYKNGGQSYSGIQCPRIPFNNLIVQTNVFLLLFVNLFDIFVYMTPSNNLSVAITTWSLCCLHICLLVPHHYPHVCVWGMHCGVLFSVWYCWHSLLRATIYHFY